MYSTKWYISSIFKVIMFSWGGLHKLSYCILQILCGMVRSQYSLNHISSHQPQPHSTYTLPHHRPRPLQPLELVHLCHKVHPCWEHLPQCRLHSTTLPRHPWTQPTCTTVCHSPTMPWWMRGLCMRQPQLWRHLATSLLKWVKFVRYWGWA